jgi:hypothetical protein
MSAINPKTCHWRLPIIWSSDEGIVVDPESSFQVTFGNIAVSLTDPNRGFERNRLVTTV